MEKKRSKGVTIIALLFICIGIEGLGRLANLQHGSKIYIYSIDLPVRRTQTGDLPIPDPVLA